ncbi:MAG TPA: hypothetical protein VNQ73_20000 [Ilumatobacter sp.]|nr:hypothetical protein [Ilumatobacter sp.]
MSRVRTVDPVTVGWRAIRVGVASGHAGQDDLEDVEVDCGRRCHRVHHPGSETELQLFEVQMPPDDVIPVHAHEADEIIVVVDGYLTLGARKLEAGCSIMIPGWTLYGIKAGPAGARFMNFRSHKDLTFMTKEQFVERRARRGLPEKGPNEPDLRTMG